MHQDPFVIEIGLEHSGPRERHPQRHRFLIELEDGDVLKLVPFFFPDVNFSPGKLIDHLVAAKKRHRVARRQIENGAAQFFLRRRRHLDRKPETKRRAHERNNAERNGDARRSEEHTSELQSQSNLVCRLLLEKKKTRKHYQSHFLLMYLFRHAAMLYD